MNKYNLILTMSFALCSCNHESNIRDIIVQEEPSYWRIFIGNIKKTNRSYAFFKNGKCYLYIHQKDGSLKKYCSSDVVLSNEWSLTNAHTLTINDVRMRITKYSIDSLFLKNEASKDMILLVKERKVF